MTEHTHIIKDISGLCPVSGRSPKILEIPWETGVSFTLHKEPLWSTSEYMVVKQLTLRLLDSLRKGCHRKELTIRGLELSVPPTDIWELGERGLKIKLLICVIWVKSVGYPVSAENWRINLVVLENMPEIQKQNSNIVNEIRILTQSYSKSYS